MALSFIDKAIEVVEDLGYNLRKWTAHILGKAGIKGVAGQLGEQLGPQFAPLLTGIIPGIGGAAKHTAATLIATPVAAAFSAALVQGDHIRRRRNLLKQYRDEIGSWLTRQTGETKDPKKLTEQDMDLAAYGDEKRGIEGNPVLKESLDQSGKARNWGVLISAISSAASTLVVGGLMESILPSGGLHYLVGGAIGFALYLPISIGIHWVAENMFGLEKFTVNDHVKSIHRMLARGHEVTQSQVLEPFLQIHPEVDTMIKAAYGRRFSKLDTEKREDVVALLAPQIGLKEMVDDLNHHRMKPEELAFVLSNQVSGVHLVDMNATAPEGPVAHLWHRFKSIFTRKAHMPLQENADVAAPAYVSVAAQSPDGNAQVAVQAYRNPQADREVSFVRMVGRKQSDDGTRSFAESVGRREVHQAANSYSEVVEQSRSNTEVQMS